MVSIIETLYHGESGRYDRIKKSKEYERLLEELCAVEKEIESLSEGELKEKINAVDLLQMQLEGEICLASYKAGFKDGILLAMETLLVD